MPQPITHYLVIQGALKNSAGILWRDYMNFAGLGSFGPDLFYLKDIGYFWTNEYNYTGISDLMHWESTYDFYCALLQYIKENYIFHSNLLNKLKAFAYGYYSHVITDCIFHPFVYRQTNDHWKLHDVSKNYCAHKSLEAIIDCYLIKYRHNMNPYTFAYYKKILCYEDGSSKKLDNDIFLIFYHGLKKAYKSHIDSDKYKAFFKKCEYSLSGFDDYFGQYSLGDDEHPVHEAYDDFADSIKELYTVRILRALPVEELRALIPRRHISENDINLMNEANENWKHSKGLNYSIINLFNMAVNIIIKVIKISELFFSSDNTDPKEFFENNNPDKIMFLNDNYNLDTGQLCSLNKKLDTGVEAGFKSGDSVLMNQYKDLK